ncbi:hypothetical protein TIFTF001_001999 [Ficus carica]|uniref:Uncharacterized protein n=1 Tax=Ficus carica TaxID=3494 RepID=A0AA87ZKS1_FICCA|nr:hypothetical protein TIFTF001_001999 [Ficus carica]
MAGNKVEGVCRTEKGGKGGKTTSEPSFSRGSTASGGFCCSGWEGKSTARKKLCGRNLFILAVEGLVLGRSVGRLPSPMGRRGLDLRRECTEAATTQSVRSAIRNPKKLGDGGFSTVEEEIRCKGGPSSPTTAWQRLSTAGGGVRRRRGSRVVAGVWGWGPRARRLGPGAGPGKFAAGALGVVSGGGGEERESGLRESGDDTGPSTGMQHHGSSTGTMNQMREMIEDAMWERYQSDSWYRDT